MDQKIYDLVVKLSTRIEVLERKIDKLSNTTHNFIVDDPPLSFIRWLETIEVPIECILMVTGNLRDAFQYAIKPLLILDEVPIHKHNNKLYVFTDDNAWILWGDENLRLLILEIWRKFIKIHMEIKPDNEEIYLAQRKCILEMRSKLYDVKKTKHELNIWLKLIMS